MNESTMKNELHMTNELSVSDLSSLRNWKLTHDDHNIYWLTLDKTGSIVNTIDTEVLREMKTLLDFITAQNPKGLVIRSGKEHGFVVGADIQQLKKVETFEEAFDLVEQGQNVFQQLANVNFPTAALISGFCLGGGLELALACSYRILLWDKKSKLGLPEVMLGVHPGWGGTVRLPRLIGGPKALELILSGRTINAETAKKMGIVDALVPIWDMNRAILHFILTKPPVMRAKGLKAMTNWDGIRPMIGKLVESNLSKKVNKQHYPAPFDALEQWVNYGVRDEAFLPEAKSISRLMIQNTTKNMVRVFNLQEKLKAIQKEVQFKPKHIHVIGAGVMGGDIAAWCALKGYRVTLQDERKEAIANALSRASLLFEKNFKYSKTSVQERKDLLMPDPQGQGLAKADLIIEAIVENKELKQKLFIDIEQKIKSGAILATNTSTLPLNTLNMCLQDPRKLIGIHFFNPVARMPLVEIVHEPNTNPLLLGQISSFVRSLDKLPLPVKSAPLFLVNRLLMPYLLESLLMLEEGLEPTLIDAAAKQFGMPMGPIELMDTVGLDICVSVFQNMGTDLSIPIPNRILQLVKLGHLGKKTGQGFYSYKDQKKINSSASAKGSKIKMDDDIVDRLILRMINEAVACLREKIVLNSDLLDAGMIFGAGFPPFRGGPIRYVKDRGEELILSRLKALSERYGERFVPDIGWSELDEF